jgi:hypothetical protein
MSFNICTQNLRMEFFVYIKFSVRIIMVDENLERRLACMI